MTRSSFAAAIVLGLTVLGSTACGDKPPPKPPESPAMEGGDDAGGGSSATMDADGGAGATAEKPSEKPAEKPAGLAMPAASAKGKFKGNKKDFDLEVKADGSVTDKGKPTAKISGMELADKDGKAALKVDGDGNITTAEGGAYAKFDGDDLASLTGWKFSIGDDGALGSTDDKGKKASLGKIEGVGSAKKTVLLAVAYSMWGLKAPQPKAGKKGDKPAGDKPAGDKPGKK